MPKDDEQTYNERFDDLKAEMRNSNPIQPTERDRERAREVLCADLFCQPIDVIATALAEVRAEERERCAKIVTENCGDDCFNSCRYCQMAAAIRRGEGA